jgi:hypothetical protein
VVVSPVARTELFERDSTTVVTLTLLQLPVPRLLLEAALLLIKLLRVALRPLLLILVSAAITPLAVLWEATVRLRKRLLTLWLRTSFLTLPLVSI